MQSRSLSSDTFLITPTELHAIPPNARKILDTTWFMPNSPRNAREEFSKLRIPGARYLDLDEVASPSEMGLKHMMPSPQQFKEAMEGFGIKRDDTVILYDTHGIFSSPRALFMFKAFKHDKAWVLNGGLPAWRDQGYEVDESQLSQAPERSGQLPEGYPIPDFDTGIIRSYEDMLGNARLDATTADLVMDARPTPRFRGVAPEPRPNLPSGHMPNSVSIPFSALLANHAYEHGGNNNQTSYTTLLPRADLQKAFVDLLAAAPSPAGLDGEETYTRILRGTQPVVVSCGSGMSAAVLWIALNELGVKRSVPLYDESWTGYASRKDSPIIVDV